MYRVIEVARMLGVSKVTIYKKMRFLKEDIKPFVVKEKNVTHITSEGVELIKDTIQVQDYDGDAKDSLKVVALENRVNELEHEIADKDTYIKTLNAQKNDAFKEQIKILKDILIDKRQTVDKLSQQLAINQSITKDIRQQIILFDEMIRLST